MKPLIVIALLAKSLDITSTCSALSRGGYYEANPLLPNSCAGQLIVQIPAASVEIYSLVKLHRNHPKLANTLAVVITGIHLSLAVHNYKEIK